MRVFTTRNQDTPRIVYDASKDEFVEHPEQAFNFIAETKEEHNAIIELIKQHTTIDEDVPCM